MMILINKRFDAHWCANNFPDMFHNASVFYCLKCQRFLLWIKYVFTVNKPGNPSRKLEQPWETKTGITSFPPWLKGLDSRQQFLPVLAECTVVLRIQQWTSSLSCSTCSHTVHSGLLNEYSIYVDWRIYKNVLLQVVSKIQIKTEQDNVDIWMLNWASWSKR